METQNQTPHILLDPYRGDARPPHNLVGIIALACFFCATAVVTFVYFRESLQQRAIIVQNPVAPTIPIIPNAFSTLSLSARSVYVYDIRSNKELFAKEPDTPLPLASLTKVATALAVSDVLSPQSQIRIPRYLGAPGRPEHLSQGDIWKTSDVLTFTLVVSSNDGAQFLADTADSALHAKYPESPTASTTVWRMNKFAHDLELTNTIFYNTNGLDLDLTHAGAYGSARDVARLFAYAASTSSDVFSGTSQDTLVLTSVNGKKTTIFNTDHALESIPSIIVGKTGLTDLAGGNLAIVFDAGPGRRIIAVVLGSTKEGRFEDMKKLVSTTLQVLQDH